MDEELEEEVLYARAIYQHNEGVFARDVFFFADGAVVFWNMADSEQKAILKILDDVTATVSRDWEAGGSGSISFFDVTTRGYGYADFNKWTVYRYLIFG